MSPQFPDPLKIPSGAVAVHGPSLIPVSVGEEWSFAFQHRHANGEPVNWSECEVEFILQTSCRPQPLLLLNEDGRAAVSLPVHGIIDARVDPALTWCIEPDCTGASRLAIVRVERIWRPGLYWELVRRTLLVWPLRVIGQGDFPDASCASPMVTNPITGETITFLGRSRVLQSG